MFSLGDSAIFSGAIFSGAENKIAGTSPIPCQDAYRELEMRHPDEKMAFLEGLGQWPGIKFKEQVKGK